MAEFEMGILARGKTLLFVPHSSGKYSFISGDCMSALRFDASELLRCLPDVIRELIREGFVSDLAHVFHGTGFKLVKEETDETG